MKFRSLFRLSLSGLLIVIGGSASGNDSPLFFRQHGGVAATAAALPDNFDQGARQVWRRAIAPGNSTPCICGDTIYVTSYEANEQQLTVTAIDRSNGKVRWQQVVAAESIEPFHPVGSPASTTPACNGRQLFVFFGSVGLLCYDLSGELLWTRQMGPFQDEFGAASSPILVDELVVLNEDHDLNSFLIALDQQTGKTVWRTARPGFTRSYSTPVVYESGGRRQIVVAGALQLAGYDAASGEKLWWINGLSRIVDSTPVVADGAIYVATWSPGGDESERLSMEAFSAALNNYDTNENERIEQDELPASSPVVPRFFRIDLNQDGQLDHDEWDKHALVFERAKNVAMRVQPVGTGDLTTRGIKWEYRQGLPTVPSSVVYDGLLYMVKDSGIITALDARTGQRRKRGRASGRGNYYASLVAGDGKVFVCSERGVVTVLQAGANWKVLSSKDFGERIMATPVIDGTEILLRTDAALYCFTKSS